MARVHASLVAGDTLVSLALAGSLFFQIDPSAARWRVGLYLLITIAPFAVVAPLIGPWMDRLAGGRRLMLIIAAAGRALVAFLMIRDLDSFLLFPEAFAMLVLGKAYAVAKSAMVPTVVDDPTALVQANSKLTLISAVAGFAAGVPGLIILRFFGGEGVLVFAVIAFLVGALLARMLPVTAVAADPVDGEEREELRSGSIRLSRQAMGLLRGIVGFLAFLLAFALRGGDTQPELGESIGTSIREGLGAPVLESANPPAWHLGLVLAVGAIGSFIASVVAPTIRQSLREERILQSVLGLAGLAAVGAAILGGLGGAALIAAAIGFCATAGKQAFDAIVQRDAPAANYGRSFASFESRFQILWAIGAFIPVAITMPARIGYILLALAALAGLTIYLLGERGILLPAINWPSLNLGRSRGAKSDTVDASAPPSQQAPHQQPHQTPAPAHPQSQAPPPPPTPSVPPVAPSQESWVPAPPPPPQRPEEFGRPRLHPATHDDNATRQVPRVVPNSPPPPPPSSAGPAPPPPPQAPSQQPPSQQPAPQQPPPQTMKRPQMPPSRAIGPDDPTEPVPEIRP